MVGFPNPGHQHHCLLPVMPALNDVASLGRTLDGLGLGDDAAYALRTESTPLLHPEIRGGQ